MKTILVVAVAVLLLAGIACASVGYNQGYPCKGADGWVNVQITDTEGNAWVSAITYECDPWIKTTGSSSNGTGGFGARPPPCTNPTVHFYINHVHQSSVSYNSLPSCP